MAKINVKDNEIAVITLDNNDYVSITDIAKFKNAFGLMMLSKTG